MPYVVRTHGKKYEVVNPLTNSIKGTHKTKRQALAQLRALYANVPDALEKRKGNVPTNPQLWMQAKNQAKQRFSVYPSAYANGWAAKWYKERGGGWKEAEEADTLQKDLRTWFQEDWVDISKPIRENGTIVGYEACGRDEATSEHGGYPKCLPKAKAMKLTEEERQRLIQRKRRAGEPTDGKPVMTSSDVKKASGGKMVLRQDWVDIAQPIKDTSGVTIGYRPCDPSEGARSCFPKTQAMQLLEKERTALLQKINQAHASMPQRKYGTYRRK